MLIENEYIKVDMQRTDEDFIDYTIYDLVNNEIDGGILEDNLISYEDAYKEIINIHKDIIIKYLEEE